jgi:manganese-transporting P-type ATPase
MALKQQEDFQKEYAELLAKGESWAMYKAMQNMYKRTVDEQKKRVGDSNTLAGSAGRMAAMMDDLENMEDVQLPMVKIGDASVASPFTSKMPSIKGCVDIIRQVSLPPSTLMRLTLSVSLVSLGPLHLGHHHSDV